MAINTESKSATPTAILADTPHLLDKLELDVDEIINMKMSQNEAKYPVEKAKGSAVKYDQL